jgi:butyrate kinase
MIGVQAIKDSRARSHIAMNDETAVRRWAKHLGTTEDELRCAVDKVGNSITAVRKQMGLPR